MTTIDFFQITAGPTVDELQEVTFNQNLTRTQKCRTFEIQFELVSGTGKKTTKRLELLVTTIGPRYRDPEFTQRIFYLSGVIDNDNGLMKLLGNHQFVSGAQPKRFYAHYDPEGRFPSQLAFNEKDLLAL